MESLKKELKLMPQEVKLLYLMLWMVIVSTSVFLVIYLTLAPFKPAIVVHAAYLSLHIYMLSKVKPQYYRRIRYTIILTYFIQLTLAVFLWFSVRTNYGLLYFLIPVATFSTMDLLNPKDKRFAIIISALSAILYFMSMTLDLSYYLYEMTPSCLKLISSISTISTVLPANFLFYNYALGLAKKRSELEYLANTDSLTKTANRRTLYDNGELEFELAWKYHHSFTLLTLDIDHFKKINDQYGHYVGDEVLKEFSDRIRATIRSEDTFARQGGEEFAIILRKTTQSIGERIAEKVRCAVAETPFIIEGQTIYVTVSIGMVQYFPTYKSFVEMLMHADKALYAAKDQGRNRLVVTSEPSKPTAKLSKR